MNTKAFIIVTIALILSIFINIALGFNISSKSHESKNFNEHNKELKNQIKKMKKGLDDAKGIISDEQLSEDSEAKRVVANFFKTQYEYNSNTYKKRFEKIRPFVNKDVYGQLTAAGIPDTPNIKFENKIKDLQLYLTAKNKEVSGLVLLDTVYKVEGVDSPKTTQIFRVKVSKQDGKEQIVSLEVLGTFAAMSES